MVRFWRQRPARKGSDQPIAKKSAEHQITALKSLVRWLSRSSKYDWKKPESFVIFAFGSAPGPKAYVARWL